LDDELICLNVHDGRRSWGFKSTFAGNLQDLGHSPALWGDRIFWGGRDGIVYALDANTGRLLWKKNLNSAISTSLLTFENHVYVGAADGHVYALNRVTGGIEKNFLLDKAPAGKLAAAPHLLFCFQNRSGTLGSAEDLISLNLSTQKILWQQPAKPESGEVIKPALESLTNGTGKQCPIPETAWSSTRPYFWREHILAGNNRGEVFAHKISDGKLAWSHKIGGTIRSLGSAESMLCVGTVEGTIYVCAFEPDALK